jgi:hypothetical protein
MGIGELPQVSVSNCGEPERTHQTNTLYANCFLWGFVWGVAGLFPGGMIL